MSCSKDASFKITFFCLFYLHLFDKAYIAQSTVTGELIFADRITAAGAFLVGFFLYIIKSIALRDKPYASAKARVMYPEVCPP